ncbi:MAG: ATP-binding protein [Bradyrhizobiaceae bacterium]|nr:ATP-binding protein [Bradyrhizobiaceae bacterium]
MAMEMIVLIGLQAAGKSTFCRQRFAGTHVLVSKDLLRNNRNPGRRQRRLIEDALRAGHSLVVDNTNATREERAELVGLGHEHGAMVTGYYFEPWAKGSLERNSLREGKARVPDVAIFATMKKLVRPSYEEGFDRLFRVRTAEGVRFDVSDWKEEEVCTDRL